MFSWTGTNFLVESSYQSEPIKPWTSKFLTTWGSLDCLVCQIIISEQTLCIDLYNLNVPSNLPKCTVSNYSALSYPNTVTPNTLTVTGATQTLVNWPKGKGECDGDKQEDKEDDVEEEKGNIRKQIMIMSDQVLMKQAG